MTKKLNANLIKIVNILNDGAFHDGTSIGKQLKMTRTAVWKAIKKLSAYDIKIDSVKGKGYVLKEPLILLDEVEIKKQLQHDKVEINIFENIPSTNAFLRAQKAQHTIILCLAEQQTAGIGRLNRDWYSPFGRNIYFSCFYSFQKDLSELAGLSLVTSLAIIKTLKDFGVDKKLHVKWPNDILYENQKLSGALIEVQAESHGICHAIIGIGINVNIMDDAERITQPWTSMQKILGTYVDRNELSARLINTLFEYLAKFNTLGFQAFINEWVQTDCLTNQVITVKNPHEKTQGKVTGVNEQGHLLLQLLDGTVRAFSSGDTTIVKKPLLDMR